MQRFKKINDTLPASPIPKQPPTQLSNPSILFPVFNIDSKPIPITPHSQHAHTCALCKIKNLPCVLSQENQHSPDYTIAIIFKTRLIHRDCLSKTPNINIKPLTQNKSLSQEQKASFHIAKFAFLSKM